MKSRGFTLIELLVVVAIIGLLSTMAVIAMYSARERARETQAMSDADSITKAMMLMADDTGKWPNGCPVEELSTSVANINLSGAGLTERPEVGNYGGKCAWTDADLAKWNGPYVNDVIDPWGHAYWFDADYYPRKNCGAPDAASEAVILSFGPNGTGVGAYDCDDIYKNIR